MTDIQTHTAEQKGKRLFRWFLITTALFALLTLVGLIISYSATDIESVDQRLHAARPWLAAWRFLLFVILIGGWRVGSKMYARWTQMDAEQVQKLLNYRWRMALWLLVMEAILSQDVLAVFVNNIALIGA